MVITFRHGEAHYVAHDDLRGVFDGEARMRRASHVVPVSPLLRVAFRVLRAVVSDRSWLATWTRRWACLWQADLAPSGGPVLGPYRDRQDAIAAEVVWLEAHVL